MAVFASKVHFTGRIFSSIRQTSPVYPFVQKTWQGNFRAEPAREVFPSVQKTFRFFGTVANGSRSQKIAELTQDFSVRGKVILYEIFLEHMGLGILRFTCSLDKNYGVLSFGGKSYVPFPLESSGFDVQGQGKNNRPTLTFSAVLPEMSALIIAKNGLQGAELHRITTFARFLDGGEEPDPTAWLFKERYIINKISPWVSGQYGKMELVNPIDMENVLLPSGSIYKNYCEFSYRYWSEEKQGFVYPKYRACPYAGALCFNEKNEPCKKEEDCCGKNLDACIVRFGENAVLPFGGFPGILTEY